MKLALVVLLETKVKQNSYNAIANSIVPNGWQENCNIDGGSAARIWVMWHPRLVRVNLNARTAQCMHCDVKYGTEYFLFSACYGFNNYIHMREL